MTASLASIMDPEQRQAAQAQAPYRIFVEAMSDGAAAIDAAGTVAYANEALSRLLRTPLADLIGSPARQLVVADDRERMDAVLREAASVPVERELQLNAADGSPAYARIAATPLRLADGTAGTAIVVHDMQSIREAARYARSLIEASLDSMVTIGPDGRIADANEATAVMVGLPRERVIGTDFADYFTEPEHARAGYRQVFAQGAVRDYPLTLRRPDGRLIELVYNASVYRDTRGTVAGVFAAARDVTDRNAAERNARLLAAIVESSDDAIYRKTLDGIVTSWNRGAERMFGYPAQEVIGQPVAMLIPAERRDEEAAVLARVAHGDPLGHFETIRVRKDGSRIEVSVSISPVKDEEDRIVAVSANARDITTRKRAEEQLRQSELRYRFIADNIADVIVTASTGGDWTYVSPSARGMLGYEPQELLGRGGWSLLHQDDTARVMEALRQMSLDCVGRDFEFRLRRKDGSWLWVDSPITVARDEAGAPASFIGILRDGTARRAAQAAGERTRIALEEAVAARTAQLEAVNTELESFAYSVSHDLRAPLRAIDGFSRILLDDYGKILDEAGKDSLQRVRAASQRMGQLIDGMLQLSRVTRGELVLAPVDLSALAGEVVQGLRVAEPSREVSVAIKPGAIVHGDARLLRAVLENLLSNAWKFTSKTPAARVEFDCEPDGPDLVVHVRDNGAGFDMQYADKLFVAFQRLHPASEFPGTGVGLATVKRVISRLGGRVWAEGAEGKGATFHFSLPRPK